MGGSLGERPRPFLTVRNVVSPVIDGALGVAPPGKRQGEWVFGIDRQAFFEQFERLGALFLFEHPGMGHGPHGVVVAAEVLRSSASRALDLGKAYRRLQGAGDLLSYP